MKAEYVKLTTKDLNLLIDVCQMVIDYKHRNLTPANWTEFELKYLPKLLTALKNNEFKVVDSQNNIVTWIIDQIAHSRRVLEGVPRRDWLPLADLAPVQECLANLRSASRGQTSYNNSKHNQQYHNLFSK